MSAAPQERVNSVPRWTVAMDHLHRRAPVWSKCKEAQQQQLARSLAA